MYSIGNLSKKLQKRENVKIFVGEQVHIGNNYTKLNSDFKIGCKKCRKCFKGTVAPDLIGLKVIWLEYKNRGKFFNLTSISIF
jgi:hypothetical protein